MSMNYEVFTNIAARKKNTQAALLIYYVTIFIKSFLVTSVTEKYIGVKRIWSIFEYNILKYILIRLI